MQATSSQRGEGNSKTAILSPEELGGIGFSPKFSLWPRKKSYCRSCLIAKKSTQTLLHRKWKSARSQRTGLKNFDHLSAHS